MSNQLRAVLHAFQSADVPLSLGQMARDLDVSPGMLDGLIAYWVHKGKLREVQDHPCGTCGHTDGCPFVIKMPRRYELVPLGEPFLDAPNDSRTVPPCGGGCCA